MGNSCIAGHNGFVQSVSNVIFGTKTLPPPNADDNSSSSSSNSGSPKSPKKLKSKKKKSKDKDSELDGSPQTTPPAQVRIDQGESSKKNAKKEVKQEESKSDKAEVKQEESKSPKPKKQEDNKPAKKDVEQEEFKDAKPEVKQGESKTSKPEVKPKAEVKQEESKPAKAEVKEEESKAIKPEVKQGESNKSTEPEVKHGESKSTKPEIKQGQSKPVKTEVKQEESMATKQEASMPVEAKVKQEDSKATKPEVNHEEGKHVRIEVKQEEIFFKPGDTFTDVVGSPYYVAPEVLRKFYGQECDVWSAGIIIYILLSGVPPFWDENEHGIFEQVLRGELDFESEPWPSISEDAKDLVKRMLVRDPKKRLTAHEVLRHPWVKVRGSAPDKPLDSAVLSRLKQFSAMHKLKKIAIKIIAERLSEDEIAGLKQMFKMIDSDNSGHITLEELQIGLNKVGANLMESEISQLMEAADLDNSGTIDYTEFVAAMLNQNKTLKEDHLFAAFSYFDEDGSGYITPDELQHVCEQFGLEEVHLEEIMNEVDQDKDGRIDYNEFVAMMENTEVGKKKIQNSVSIVLRDAFKGGGT
ncbi:Calcium-dependent protein kinase 20 [Heracleum sosnowskyi]|uniref:non-specific serine/threonine protein kinase n=1 Tax=Heracleum sosnowskyi TaxID=360622 RepID=A0AAD8IGT6_9APIA|nr:Calcium-dependent protein kinase 20 [Heracleum sosnowskyi]